MLIVQDKAARFIKKIIGYWNKLKKTLTPRVHKVVPYNQEKID